jgi:hypothetical protein
MTRAAKLQLVGPAVLFATVLAAESAVYALAYDPTSQILWFVNLKLFGLFQHSYYVLSSVVDIEGFQLVFIALPLMLAALLGIALRRPLLLAIASNMSLVYASFLTYCSNIFGTAPQQAALGLWGEPAVPTGMPTGPYLYLILVLLGSALVSFAVSHIEYFRAIRKMA